VPVDLAVSLEFREVVDEGGVDHSFRGGRSATQAFEVFKITAMDLRTGGNQRLGARIRASKTEHAVSRCDQFFDNGGADESGRAGNKDMHDETLPIDTKANIGA
jgi:hypothetical protein